MIAIVVLLLWRLYDEYPDDLHQGSPDPLDKMLMSALRAVVATPGVVRMFSFSFIATLGYFFSYAYVSLRIIELVPEGDPATAIGTSFGVAGIATLVATPLWGVVADRAGHARLLPLVTVLAAGLYVPLYFARDLAEFTVSLFLLSSVNPSINSLTFALIGIETPPEKRNAVMSMVFMPLNAAILVGPILAGFIIAQVRDVFLYSAGIVAAAGAFYLASALWLRRREREVALS
jgi:predicted MFS family arabinose efflux permease